MEKSTHDKLVLRNAQAAGKAAREETLRIMNDSGVTFKRALLRLKQAMNAKDTKVFYDRTLGECVYSKPMVEHSTRLQAIKIVLELLDVFPSKRHEVTGAGGGPVEIQDEAAAELMRQILESGITRSLPGGSDGPSGD